MNSIDLIENFLTKNSKFGTLDSSSKLFKYLIIVIILMLFMLIFEKPIKFLNRNIAKQLPDQLPKAVSVNKIKNYFKLKMEKNANIR